MTEGDLFRNPNLGVLFFLTIFVLTIYGLFLANWSNNFKGSFLVFFVVLFVNGILCICSFDFCESLLIQSEMLRFLPLYPFYFYFYRIRIIMHIVNNFELIAVPNLAGAIY